MKSLSLSPTSNNDDQSTNPETMWSWAEDKQFEIALVMFPDDTPDRWDKIADHLPGKTATQVFQHYEDLIQDVANIDAGGCDSMIADDYDDEGFGGGQVMTCLGSGPSIGNESSKTTSVRRKGTPWTKEEHRLFLEGLEKYGKGDWRSISRHAVMTRNPTQVASHAQKYFLRLNSVNIKKRPSIHDVGADSNSSECSSGVQPAAFPGVEQEPDGGAGGECRSSSSG